MVELDTDPPSDRQVLDTDPDPTYYDFIYEEKTCAEILEQSMEARNRVGIGLSYRPARLHRLAESNPGLLKKVKKIWAMFYCSTLVKDLNVGPVSNIRFGETCIGWISFQPGEIKITKL